MRTISCLCSGMLTASLLVAGGAWADVPIVDLWRYTLEPPPQGWEQPDFDDAAWQEAYGGFGTPGREKMRVDTPWETEDIWLRKIISLDTAPEEVALYICHNDGAEVYLNGQRIAEFTGVTHRYFLHPLDEAAMAAVRPGPNTLAIHCRNEGGIQFIDAHLVPAGEAPVLPPTQSKRYPFKTELITPWGREVTPDNAWTEYPRPQLARDSWQNLNGLWAYAITPAKQKARPEKWEGEILVPFALESRLGGVQRLLQPDEALWYRRSFEIDSVEGKRTHLHFEAVDYRCEVWVNTVHVGGHQGGNTPFALEVTEAVRPGVNEIAVRVEDETEAWQLHGKQVIDPRAIWYTRVSGIWQTVWLEQTGAAYIEDLDIGTDAETGTIRIAAKANGPGNAWALRVSVKDEGETVATGEGAPAGITITVDNPKLWSPDAPHLYTLDIALLDGEGNLADHVTSYTGIRTVGKTRDDAGHLRFTLNGQTIFHWGPLDQGWWPDGLLTPPSDAAMRYDIEYLKAAGFNMIRKHIKVEPRRYYYHCDRLGMMVWQDQPSAGHGPPWTFMRPDPADADWPEEHHQQFMRELDRMVTTLQNSPAIVVWVPFNEAWGQHRTVEVGQWLMARDPSRLVNIASGGNFWPVGHIADAHAYPEPTFPLEDERFKDFIKVIGEFGGHGYPVEGRLWNPELRNWGYGHLPETEVEYKGRYRASIERLQQLRQEGIAGGVYTQTTDVESEINGLLTYDRVVAKISAEELAGIHRELLPKLAGGTP